MLLGTVCVIIPAKELIAPFPPLKPGAPSMISGEEAAAAMLGMRERAEPARRDGDGFHGADCCDTRHALARACCPAGLSNLWQGLSSGRATTAAIS